MAQENSGGGGGGTDTHTVLIHTGWKRCFAITSFKGKPKTEHKLVAE